MANKTRTELTQAELDVARLVMTAGCLQLSVAAALSKMTGDMNVAASLESYRLQAQELCEMILTGQIRGTDAGQA